MEICLFWYFDLFSACSGLKFGILCVFGFSKFDGLLTGGYSEYLAWYKTEILSGLPFGVKFPCLGRALLVLCLDILVLFSACSG